MLDQYEKMSDSEKESFKSLISTLLEHTYVFKYDYSDNLSRRQSDAYYFAKRNIEVINEYLNIIGYGVDIDDIYGICYISSFPSSARSRFDKLTTSLIYTLRHLYENGREESTSSTVLIKVGELISAYEDLSEVKKKPTNKEIANALRTIRNAHLILKEKGDFDSDSTNLLILPSILLVLPQQRILALEEEFIGDEEEILLSDDDEEEGE